MKKTNIIKTAIAIQAATLLWSCSKKAEGTDKEIYDKSVPTSGYTYYKNSNSLLDKSAGSGHSDPKLVVRFNAAAAVSLEGNGKVKQNATFAEGSLIVKDLYDKNNALTGYAIMYKKTGDANADSRGWLWGVYNADGTLRQSITKKGSGCTGCHSGAGNIDASLMNVSFP